MRSDPFKRFRIVFILFSKNLVEWSDTRDDQIPEAPLKKST